MIPCDSCERHIRTDASACPFCGARAASTITAAVLGLALAACGPAVGNESTSDGETTGTPGTTTMPASTSSTSTGAPMTSSSTTVDPTTGSVDTGTSSSSGNDDEDDAPCAFYGCACCDFGEVGPIECDVLAQDCPKDEKCMPWANDGGASWNATRCTPVDAEPDAPGEACIVEGSAVSGIDSCVVGAMCWDVDPETLEGTCVAMCVGSFEAPTCDEPGTACLLSNEDVLALCLPTCDPKLPTCAEDEVCVPAEGGASVCAPTGG